MSHPSIKRLCAFDSCRTNTHTTHTHIKRQKPPTRIQIYSECSGKWHEKSFITNDISLTQIPEYVYRLKFSIHFGNSVQMYIYCVISISDLLSNGKMKSFVFIRASGSNKRTHTQTHKRCPSNGGHGHALFRILFGYGGGSESIVISIDSHPWQIKTLIKHTIKQLPSDDVEIVCVSVRNTSICIDFPHISIFSIWLFA